MKTAGKILVATDFDASSERALEEAIVLARGLGASIELAHVEPLPPASPAELIARRQPDIVELEEARRNLELWAQKVEEQKLSVGTHLAVGAVVFGLLDVIDHVKPQLVVMGSHGKGALRRALVGSVAESVVRRSPVPVLVVPPAWRAKLAAAAAWACADCGNVLQMTDSRERCRACGTTPARWISAANSDEPAAPMEAHRAR
jgi:nucleotide-binding universal stress UspA family protein